jgi:hypothetical protein
MMFYTIAPIESLFPELYADERQFVLIERGNIQMQVEPIDGGQGRIIRLISTDPAHYLQPALQPGMLVDLDNNE